MDHASVGKLQQRVALADYVSVAQLFLRDNFTLARPLAPDDIKPRLLGHWGTCHGINVFYANLRQAFPDIKLVIGPGHGFPALQANLWLDGELARYDVQATVTPAGLAYICQNFSWPYGFPSHASPFTPGVILEGGELGYSLGQAYGAALGRPQDTIAVLIGDGEMETASLLASLNLSKLVDRTRDARVLPVLHLNSYKISAPTIYGRISEHELHSLLRGFGYQPLDVSDHATEDFQATLQRASQLDYPFIIMHSDKGATGPDYLDGQKIAGNYLSHQIPLPLAKTDPAQLAALETWLRSYQINWQEVFHG
jgi:xylulose-5-phosphate/fructose-6-phosphate phosphoketolase